MGLRKTDGWMLIGLECPSCFESLISSEDVRAGDKFKCPVCKKTARVEQITGPYRESNEPTTVEVNQPR